MMTSNWLRCWAGAISTLLAVSIVACATAPDPEVQRAQGAVKGARADPLVVLSEDVVHPG
jgi:hypothetical protein